MKNFEKSDKGELDSHYSLGYSHREIENVPHVGTG